MKNCFLLLIMAFGLCMSCTSFKNEIKSNSKKTELIFDKLLNENGNAFVITATHINFSRVWTYKNNKIEVHKIVSGKVTQSLYYNRQKNNWLNLVEEEDRFEFNACIELDGDNLKYSVIKKDSKIKNNLPINIKCFINIENKNDFYSQLANDIKTYKLELN